MEVIKGYVDKIVYRNDDNGYTVFSLVDEGEETTCVGTLTFINEGEFLNGEGTYTEHSTYGSQFQITNYEIKEPESLFSIERYLGSGAIKGIGAALAARVVKRFKKDTIRIIEEEPERLVEIKGISEKKAREIAQQFNEKRDMRQAMLFLGKFGISINFGVKIYKEYGNKMYDILRENPYRLAEDISGIGFKIADEIAGKAGIGFDSEFRIKSGILYVLMQASGNGHVYLPENELSRQTAELLNINLNDIDKHIMDMMIDKKIFVKERKGERIVYNAYYYYMELNVARMLHDLNVKGNNSDIEPELLFKRIESDDIELDEMQKKAVMEAVKNGLLIITGGPGTGKTTAINAIIKCFQEEGLNILLAAPTGRAAKRMTEATGYEAQTIHRMLELSGVPEEEDAKYNFAKDSSNPLEADVIIIDEMSMVDISLMSALLKAVTIGTRLIMVGDVNQLPSVGPGNVLGDMITSEVIKVVMLKKIFRQASESDIIVNAHKINEGSIIKLDNKSKDFFFLRRDDSNLIIQTMLTLILHKLPNYVKAKPYDIQVLTPMRKGELGVEKLNQTLQKYLNEKSPDKNEKEFRQGIFREGDKVMQIKNNYQIEWQIKNKYGIAIDSGSGVFNGDSGVIKEINHFAETVTVEFDEGKQVEYTFSQLDELELAYAVTIHKSQGSEYPAVIIPLLTGPKMLFNRNLLYTAVTRAKKCVTIVGIEETVKSMIDNQSEQKRYSGLNERIEEIYKEKHY